MGWQFLPGYMPGADTASTRNTGFGQKDYWKLIRMDILHTFMTGEKDMVHKSHCRNNQYIHDYMKE